MKKFLTVLLSGIMMAGLFTACTSGGEVSSQPEPEPTPKVWYQNPLTGEEQSIDYPYGVSPVAVMVNNIMSMFNIFIKLRMILQGNRLEIMS